MTTKDNEPINWGTFISEQHVEEESFVWITAPRIWEAEERERKSAWVFLSV